MRANTPIVRPDLAFGGRFGQSEEIAPDASESAIGTRWYKKIDPSQNYHRRIL